jgi:hypothetical protein
MQLHPDYDLTVGIFPTPQGNYGFLLHERISGETAIVDPMDAGRSWRSPAHAAAASIMC